MSERSGAIFVIVSDKNQTINEAILKEKNNIMNMLKFQRHMQDLEIEDTPEKYFDKLFLSWDQYYNVYTYEPKFTHEMITKLKKGQVIIAIITKNSAGCWEQLQVIPAKSGVSSIKYFTEQEIIYMPS
jgi:NAD-dependent SIR2 family protein deacetylase